MTLPFRRLSRSTRRCLRLILAAGLGISGSSAMSAASCGERFAIAVVPTVFDGFTYEAVILRSKAITLETATFGPWQPDESGTGPAALTLLHQQLEDVRVEFCPLYPPDLPQTAGAWLAYQEQVAARLGEGTIVSNQLDTSTGAEGVHVFGWETREARFTRPAPTGGVQAMEFHFVLRRGNVGLRIILHAPPAVFDRALADLRFWFSRVTVPDMR